LALAKIRAFRVQSAELMRVRAKVGENSRCREPAEEGGDTSMLVMAKLCNIF
jgi:hypothetical protein